MEQFKRIDKIHYLYEVNDVLPDERKVDAVGGGGITNIALFIIMSMTRSMHVF